MVKDIEIPHPSIQSFYAPAVIVENLEACNLKSHFSEVF